MVGRPRSLPGRILWVTSTVPSAAASFGKYRGIVVTISAATGADISTDPGPPTATRG